MKVSLGLGEDTKVSFVLFNLSLLGWQSLWETLLQNTLMISLITNVLKLLNYYFSSQLRTLRSRYPNSSDTETRVRDSLSKQIYPNIWILFGSKRAFVRIPRRSRYLKKNRKPRPALITKPIWIPRPMDGNSQNFLLKFLTFFLTFDE